MMSSAERGRALASGTVGRRRMPLLLFDRPSPVLRRETAAPRWRAPTPSLCPHQSGAQDAALAHQPSWNECSWMLLVVPGTVIYHSYLASTMRRRSPTRHLGHALSAVSPPSIGNISPVTQRDSSDARYSAP